MTWGLPRIEGEDLCVAGEFLACCDEDREEAWGVLPLVEADTFVLGLPPPPPPLEMEDVVGEPTNIGGEGDWLLLLLLLGFC